MAPNRRAKNDHHGGGGHAGPQHHNNQRNGHHGNGGGPSMPLKCVRPKGCLEPKRSICMDDIESGTMEVVRLTCNNLQCEQGNYMHVECFNDWETSVLNFLSSTGRARSWSVKQRQQNLWTKKGYDLAFKACDCTCGKGHLRKDLDWISPKEKLDRIRIQNAVVNPPVQQLEEVVPAPQNQVANNQNHQQTQQAVGNQQNNTVATTVSIADTTTTTTAAAAAAAEEKKKKKKKAKESLPTLSLSAHVPHPNDNHSRKVASTTAPIKTAAGNGNVSSELTSTSNLPFSVSSSSGIGSFGSDSSESPSPPSGPWNVPESLCRPRINSLSSNASGSSGAFSGSSSSGSPPSPGAQFGSPISSANSILAQNIFKFQRKNYNGAIGGGPAGGTDRIRHNSTGSLFSRRNDFSSFNFLPKQKQNSYHIKMDDDGHGNDDMRFVVLATLQNQRMTKVNCCMCQSNMIIYDRYPLIDGTFFMTPRKYGKESIPMTPASGMADGVSNTRYLSAICMHCLSGKCGGIVCKSCSKAFDGTALVLGAIYSYDVFASMACCRKRVECGNCRAVMHNESYKFFCQGSSLVRCYRCGFMDFHFAKPLEAVYDRIAPEQFDKILRRQKVEEKIRVMRMTNSLAA